MKKFTLLSAIAALATVGSVFAAWEFTGGQTSKSANADKSIAVTIDKTVTTIGGLSGEASMSLSGNVDVKYEQSATNSYVPVINEKLDQDEAKGTFTVSYTPGTYEEAKESYSAVITIKVASATAGLNGTSWTHAAITLSKDQNSNVYSGTLSLEDLLKDITYVAAASNQAGLASVLNELSFTLTASAVVS